MRRKQTTSLFNKGFTIVELLIVVAIAALLLSIAVVLMNRSQVKSRDAAREQGIKQIQNALSIYATAKGTFPVCDPEIVINGQTDCLSNALLSELAMQGAVPTDPLNTGTVCGAANTYRYCYFSTNGFTYTLRYALETDTISGKSSGWQSVGP